MPEIDFVRWEINDTKPPKEGYACFSLMSELDWNLVELIHLQLWTTNELPGTAFNGTQQTKICEFLKTTPMDLAIWYLSTMLDFGFQFRDKENTKDSEQMIRNCLNDKFYVDVNGRGKLSVKNDLFILRYMQEGWNIVVNMYWLAQQLTNPTIDDLWNCFCAAHWHHNITDKEDLFDNCGIPLRRGNSSHDLTGRPSFTDRKKFFSLCLTVKGYNGNYDCWRKATIKNGIEYTTIPIKDSWNYTSNFPEAINYVIERNKNR